MTFKVQSYDNMQREYIFQDDGKVLTKATQYLDGHLDYCNNKRNNENVTGKMGEWHHTASIPMVIVEELMKKGINMLSGDQDQMKAAKREIDLNYPHLKTTNKKGW
jgi:hypothetical protein